MPTTQGTYSDRVKYSLINNDYGSIEGITEPLNWDSDDKTLERNKTLHGIFPKYSGDLTFTEEAASHIESIYRNYGINSKIIIIREERHPNTDVFQETYRGELDLTKLKKSDNGNITVRFNSGGIEKIRKSRQNVKVELERISTLDGVSIPELETKKVAYNGRDIFLTSEVKQEQDKQYELVSSTAYFPMTDDTIDNSLVAISPLANLIYESDDQVNAVIYEPISTIPGNDLFQPYYTNGDVGNTFYSVAQLDKTITLKIAVEFKIDQVVKGEPLVNPLLKLVLLKYNNGVTLDFVSREVLYDFGNPANNVTNTLSFNTEMSYDLLTNESLVLALEQDIDLVLLNSSSLRTTFTVSKWQINIDEASVRLPSQGNTLLAHEAAERILKIITGEDNIFYSSLLGGQDIGYEEDGTARYTGLSHGYWVRGFEKGDNLYKSISSSWRDFFQSIDAIYNVGLGLEYIKGKQRFVLEDKKYFYSRNVTIRLGDYDENGVFQHAQIYDVEREVDDTLYYSDIEIGFAKGGEYEEVMGLDEYNIKSQFSTVIKALENSYKSLSKYRGDSYGKEIARRKGKSDFPLEDTRYDNDVFIQDLKKGDAEVLQERLWQDDFEEEPTGVYSPETATNLRYTPLNCLLRHAWYIAGGLEVYADDFIRYASSESNSQLITKLKQSLYPDYGGIARAENGSIRNGDIKGVRFFPEKVSFKYEVDFKLSEILEGSTVLPNGKTVPNLYGLIEYKNENGTIERAYLSKLKPNSGEWEVLTANY